MDDSFILSFSDVTTADGNRFAGSLASSLREADPNVSVERLRERADTQDFGASLAVILGTAAATAIAKGIATWLARNSGAKLEIRRNGKLVLSASQIDSKDVPKIAAAFAEKG
jgi:hypothetical protein